MIAHEKHVETIPESDSGGGNGRGTAGGGMLLVEIMPRLEFFEWHKVCSANFGAKIPRERRRPWGAK